MFITDFLKVILFGIVEGFTEWLPISSTGHLILLENVLHLDEPQDFFDVFKVVVQLGAILACVWLYWDRLWPFSPKRTPKQRQIILKTWVNVFFACIPAAVIGYFLDDILDEYLSTPIVIATTLIFYGVILIVMENVNKKRHFYIKSMRVMSLKTAVYIGLFQCLSLIPGTSRSGATIIGAMLLGCSRSLSAEFSFFLGIPVMFGASLLKLIKHGFVFTGEQYFLLLIGMFISFIVACFSIRFLIRYIKKHNFKIFGYYRIVLGIVVLIWFG